MERGLMSNDDINHRSVMSAAGVHFLLEYFLASSAGDSHIAAVRSAGEISGHRVDRSIISAAAQYYRATRAAQSGCCDPRPHT